MSEVTPIRGIRPRPELAARIVAPPYDVLDSQEARELAEGNAQTWLHVSKPEIDLDPGVDLYDETVYAKARENYASFLDSGWFIQDSTPCYYIYRLSIGGHSQTGILAGAVVREYEAGLIKKHELTRADKEADRTRHTEVLEAHSGPVFLAYRKQPAIDKLVAAATSVPPTYDTTTYDGVRNELWVVSDTDALRAEFAKVPCLYIADGHHRAASYCRVGGARRDAQPKADLTAPHHVFLAVIFPHDQLRILPYNRFVLDLNGLSPAEFLGRVSEKFEVSETAPPSPARRHEIAMYLGGRWMGLTPKAGTFDEANPIRSLDVSILQENLLAPILGIDDPRRSKRIDFIGGIRGTGELERRVSEGGGGGVAFSMFPTSLDELMAIADAGEIMPPKSTWFEPKLKDGFVIHSLVEARRPAAAASR
jgi:uncharacterized protein (DUF1015 family)